MQGPQGTACARQISWRNWVRLHSMCVGPNSETTGTPKAGAKNRGPLSVLTSSRLRRMQALVSPIGSCSSPASETTPG